MRWKWTPAILVTLILLGSLPGRTRAEEPVERTEDVIRQMRLEIEELKRQIRELREQLESSTPSTPTPVPPPSAPQLVAPPVPPVTTSPATVRDPKVFNPAISVVFQAIGTNSINHDLEEDGFELSEAEIGFQATVDPYARVDLFVALNSEGEAEVEEGFATLQALPGGLQAKGGRFKNAFGRWNLLHDHRFPTVEPPNVLTLFFGEESLVTDGASVSWLVPGTGSVFLETISEIGSTGNDVSFNADGSDPVFLQRLGSAFNLTANATLDAGVTGVHGRVGPTESLLDDIEAAGLSGSVFPEEGLASNIFGADFRYLWKPVQYNVYRSFMVQGEIFRSKRRIESLTPGGSLDRDTIRATGGYGYAEYQFARRWRSGLRYDASQYPDDPEARERAIAAILKFTPSEFQEFRIQFKHTGRNDAAASLFDDIQSDNEILIEWIPVIGTHPAHEY